MRYRVRISIDLHECKVPAFINPHQVEGTVLISFGRSHQKALIKTPSWDLAICTLGRPYLCSRYKQRQLLDFILEIFAIDNTAKVKHFGALINVSPETVFEQFLRLAKVLGRPKLIQMRKHTHDFGKAVYLQNVEELKGFHFKAKLGIDTEQHEISNLGTI